MSNAHPAQNRYKADLRELRFLLFEQFKLGEVLGLCSAVELGRGAPLVRLSTRARTRLAARRRLGRAGLGLRPVSGCAEDSTQLRFRSIPALLGCV